MHTKLRASASLNERERKKKNPLHFLIFIHARDYFAAHPRQCRPLVNSHATQITSHRAGRGKKTAAARAQIKGWKKNAIPLSHPCAPLELSICKNIFRPRRGTRLPCTKDARASCTPTPVDVRLSERRQAEGRAGVERAGPQKLIDSDVTRVRAAHAKARVARRSFRFAGTISRLRRVGFSRGPFGKPDYEPDE